MATKDYNLLSKGNYNNLFVEDVFDNQLNNLNLNQTHKCFHKDSDKKEKKSNVNNSTLSLHIAAYENLNDEASTEFCDDKDYKLKSKKLDLVKKWKTAKASIIENRFEFPRQQITQP
uniref:Uncharacterized protein n=1 Tax=Panagrolaimus sp. ES5 TaxID=591445 RepID=A0AC34GD32_9BILA